MIVSLTMIAIGVIAWYFSYRNIRRPLTAPNYVPATEWIADTEHATQKHRQWARIIGVVLALVGAFFIAGGLITLLF